MQSIAQTIYTEFNYSLLRLIDECNKKGVETDHKQLRTTEYMFTDGSYILISAYHVTPYESK